MSNLALSPTGKRIAVEARGEIFTIPAERATSAISRTRARRRSASRRGRPTASSCRTSATSPASTRSTSSRRTVSTPPREIKIPTTGHFYTAAWSPDGKRIMFHDTNLKLWVVDVATGQAKIVGNDPWMVPTRTMNPGVVAGRQVDRVREASELALSRDRSRERRNGRREAGDRRPRRRRVAGVGRERQVSLVPRVDRLRAPLAVAGHDELRSHRERSVSMRRCCARRSVAVPAGERRGGRAGRCSAGRLRWRRSRWPRRRRSRRQPVPTARQAASKRPVPRRARRCRPSRSTSTASSIAFSPCREFRNASTRTLKSGVAGMVYFLEAAGWRWRRSRRRGRRRDAASLLAARPSRRAVRHGRGGLRREPRRAQAGVSRRWRRRRSRRPWWRAGRRRRPAALPCRRRSQSAAGGPGGASIR